RGGKIRPPRWSGFFPAPFLGLVPRPAFVWPSRVPGETREPEGREGRESRDGSPGGPGLPGSRVLVLAELSPPVGRWERPGNRPRMGPPLALGGEGSARGLTPRSSWVAFPLAVATRVRGEARGRQASPKGRAASERAKYLARRGRPRNPENRPEREMERR